MKLLPILLFPLFVASGFLEARTILISKNINYLEDIEYQGTGKVIIKQGAPTGVQIEGEEEIVRDMKIKAQSGVLKITRKESPFKPPSEPPTCTITVAKAVHKITLRGDAALQTDKLSLQDLQINAHDRTSGTISLTAHDLLCRIFDKASLTLDGQVKHQEVLVEDFGRYLASQLLSQDCEVKVAGNAEAEVRAEEGLAAFALGQGKIYYSQEPKQLSKRISGGGQILKR